MLERIHVKKNILAIKTISTTQINTNIIVATKSTKSFRVLLLINSVSFSQWQNVMNEFMNVVCQTHTIKMYAQQHIKEKF